MNDAQLLRYSRHILLDEIGIEGQERLRSAHVLVVGAGGLGSPAAIYLAVSGVGHLTLVDDDAVDLTNLQRQILHGTPDLGLKKVKSGASALARLNPECQVHMFEDRIDGAALKALVPKATIVLDCSDNFATRHAVNRACVLAKIPLVSGSALRFDGQIVSFDLRDNESPCYACLFPETDEVEEAACSSMGVFAPLTGIVGCSEAGEAIKLIVGLPTAVGRLIAIDALSMNWNVFKFFRDSSCAVCGMKDA